MVIFYFFIKHYIKIKLQSSRTEEQAQSKENCRHHIQPELCNSEDIQRKSDDYNVAYAVHFVNNRSCEQRLNPRCEESYKSLLMSTVAENSTPTLSVLAKIMLEQKSIADFVNSTEQSPSRPA